MKHDRKNYPVKVFNSFEEAEKYELEEMRKLSYQERLSIALTLSKRNLFGVRIHPKGHKGVLKLFERKQG